MTYSDAGFMSSSVRSSLKESRFKRNEKNKREIRLEEYLNSPVPLPMPCHHFSSSLHSRRPRQASAPSPTWCLPFFCRRSCSNTKTRSSVFLTYRGAKLQKYTNQKCTVAAKSLSKKLTPFAKRAQTQTEFNELHIAHCTEE